MLSLVIWVAIDIILWGFMTKYLNTVTAAGFDFVPVLLGAVLIWDFFTRVMLGVTMAFFEDVWSQEFPQHLWVTDLDHRIPCRPGVLEHHRRAHSGCWSCSSLATALFGLSFLSYGGLLVPFLMVLFLFGIALGIVGCSFVLAVRTLGGVVRLADSSHPVSIRRRLLSDFHDADLDSVARARVAASVCL